jgi:hypothetical protein
MERLTENKIVLVKRKTRLEDLIARYNTVAQAKFYIEHLGSENFQIILLKTNDIRRLLPKLIGN